MSDSENAFGPELIAVFRDECNQILQRLEAFGVCFCETPESAVLEGQELAVF